MCTFFNIFQKEHIVQIIDAMIFDEGPREVFILMELGEMDFDKYLQSPAAEAEAGTMPHCQEQGFHDGGNSR